MGVVRPFLKTISVQGLQKTEQKQALQCPDFVVSQLMSKRNWKCLGSSQCLVAGPQAACDTAGRLCQGFLLGGVGAEEGRPGPSCTGGQQAQGLGQC